jgi:hypothetical protein
MTTAPKLIIPEDKHAKAMVMIDNARCTFNSLHHISGSSTYPRLHEMVEEVKRIEIKLGVVLEVVHVPGDMTIITKGMDGLS